MPLAACGKRKARVSQKTLAFIYCRVPGSKKGDVKRKHFSRDAGGEKVLVITDLIATVFVEDSSCSRRHFQGDRGSDPSLLPPQTSSSTPPHLPPFPATSPNSAHHASSPDGHSFRRAAADSENPGVECPSARISSSLSCGVREQA